MASKKPGRAYVCRPDKGGTRRGCGSGSKVVEVDRAELERLKKRVERLERGPKPTDKSVTRDGSLTAEKRRQKTRQGR